MFSRLLVLRVVTLSLIPVMSASPANSAGNYHPFFYDRTVPQFTPDGRLLQVEYAQLAADHSSPVAAAVLGDDLAILCCVHNAMRKHQERLIVLPRHNIVVAMAGVLADNLSLLQTIQQHILNDYIRFNGKKGCSAAELARVASTECQERVLGGGIRPVGSTLWITGTDSIRDGSSLLLHKTDPSGALHTIELGTAKGRVAVLGGGTAGGVLQRTLEKFDSDNSREQIQSFLESMLKERNQDDETPVCLEVVLLSKRRGILKLTQLQISSILEEYKK
jgi:20S proteasome alpha/beta subunit